VEAAGAVEAAEVVAEALPLAAEAELATYML
jgi:hypothetical protein